MNPTPFQLPATAVTPGLPRLTHGTKPGTFGPKATQRTITHVRDHREGGDLLVQAAVVLDPLSTAAFAALRRTIAEHAGGAPLFTCALCGAPVRASAGRAGDGKGAYFSHSSKTASKCAWRDGTSVQSLGALQFDGRQESPAHFQMKIWLAESVRADPDFSDVVLETVISIGPRWRKPDVTAAIGGQQVAFEVQLARPMLNTLVERAEFYRDAGMRLVWVTSAEDMVSLESQAFRDLFFVAGGRIFTVDQASVQRSEDTSTLHLRELSLEPKLNAPMAVYNRWSTKMVGPDVILMPEAQRHAEGQQRYGDGLVAQVREGAPQVLSSLKLAIARGQALTTLPNSWENLRRLVGGRDLKQAVADELPMVLSWLHHVEMLESGDPTAVDPVRQKVALGAMAILKARTGRNWIPLIELVAEQWPDVAAALPPEAWTLMAGLKGKGGKLHPFHLYHRHMLSVLHPALAFWLLAKSPAHRPAPERLIWLQKQGTALRGLSTPARPRGGVDRTAYSLGQGPRGKQREGAAYRPRRVWDGKQLRTGFFLPSSKKQEF